MTNDKLTFLVWDSLTNSCSWEASLCLTSLSSAANDTTFLLKLNFFSVRSFNNGSKSDDDGANFSETDIAKPQKSAVSHPITIGKMTTRLITWTKAPQARYYSLQGPTQRLAASIPRARQKKGAELSLTKPNTPDCLPSSSALSHRSAQPTSSFHCRKQ